MTVNIQEVHIHISDPINLQTFKEQLMATIKEEIKAAIAAERAEVQAKLAELAASITALQGQVLSPADVTDLVGSINDISEPLSPPPLPTPNAAGDPPTDGDQSTTPILD